jgi:hypothetical protein
MVSFNFGEQIKILHDKDKLKQFMSTKGTLQKVLKGAFHRKEEEKQT